MKSKMFSLLVSIISFCVLIFHQCAKENSDYNKSSANYSLKIGNEYDQDLIPFLTKEGLYGYFSRTLNKLVIPAHYKEAGFFKDGYAEAETEEGEKVSISCDFEYELMLPTADSILNKKQIDSLKKYDNAEERILLTREASESFDKLISKLEIEKNQDQNLYFYPNIEMLVLEVGNSFYIKSKDSSEFSNKIYTRIGDFVDRLTMTIFENSTTGKENFLFLEADGRKLLYRVKKDGDQFYHVTSRTYLYYHENFTPFIIEYCGIGLLFKKVYFDRCMSFEDAYNLALAESYFTQQVDLPEKWDIKELSYLGADCWAFSCDKSIYKIYYPSKMKSRLNLINLTNPFNNPRISSSGGVNLMTDLVKGKLAFCTRKGSIPQFIYYQTADVIQSHRCLYVNEVSNEKRYQFYIDEFGLIFSESRLQIPLTNANGVQFSVDSSDKGLIHCYEYNPQNECCSYKYLEETKGRDEDIKKRRRTKACTIL